MHACACAHDGGERRNVLYCSQNGRGSWTGRRPGSGGLLRLGDTCRSDYNDYICKTADVQISTSLISPLSETSLKNSIFGENPRRSSDSILTYLPIIKPRRFQNRRACAPFCSIFVVSGTEGSVLLAQRPKSRALYLQYVWMDPDVARVDPDVARL